MNSISSNAFPSLIWLLVFFVTVFLLILYRYRSRISYMQGWMHTTAEKITSQSPQECTETSMESTCRVHTPMQCKDCPHTAMPRSIVVSVNAEEGRSLEYLNMVSTALQARWKLANGRVCSLTGSRHCKVVLRTL